MTICLLITWPINQRWHCWEHFETKDTKRCILAHFEWCFWKLKMMSKCWKQGQFISEVGTAENILKPRTIYGALWRYLKRCSAEKTLKAKTQNGAFYCYLNRCLGNMFITEIALNKTIRYNVKLLASRFLLLTPFAFWTHLCICKL